MVQYGSTFDTNDHLQMASKTVRNKRYKQHVPEFIMDLEYVVDIENGPEIQNNTESKIHWTHSIHCN